MFNLIYFFLEIFMQMISNIEKNVPRDFLTYMKMIID